MKTPRATSKPDMRRWTAEEKAEIAGRFAAGETMSALASAYGTTKNMVEKFARQAGAKRLRADGRAYLRYLTADEKATIVARYQAGESTPTLAAAFACTHGTINRVLRVVAVARRTNSTSHIQHALRADAFDTASPERDYWLGFLFADGCVHYHSSSGAPALKVGLAERDAGHLYKLRDFLGSTHKVRHVTVTAKAGGPRYPVADLYIRSAVLVASLERLGMRRKSLERVALPEFEDSRHFWRGAVDGDGTVGVLRGDTLRPLIQLCGGLGLVGQFRDYLERNAVRCPSVRQGRPGVPCWYLAVSGDRALPGIRLLYANAIVVLDRKAARASEFL